MAAPIRLVRRASVEDGAQAAGWAGPPAPGLEILGDGVVLSALRRRGDELEVRLVAETAAATTAVIGGRPISAARDVDLLGRAGDDLAIASDGTVRITLRAWEIRTIRLRLA